MGKFKVGRKIIFAFGVFICAVCLSVGAFLGVTSYVMLGTGSGGTMSAGALNADNDSGRVTMLDLMGRYPIDYVIGPVDVEGTQADGKTPRTALDSSGKYTYKNTNYELDIYGNKVKGSDGDQTDSAGYKLTNNVHGIPADKYFDVESYIYYSGTTLRGWKADIRAVLVEKDGTAASALAENGEILETGGTLSSSANPIGIYVNYTSTSADYGTTKKYALIVPDYITAIGAGSGAYVAGGTAYYNSATNINNAGIEVTYPSSDTTNGATFTDFSAFITNRLNRDEAPYFWQPRERLAGVYFTENSNLTSIAGGINAACNRSYFAERRTSATAYKSAFQSCNNMRFFVLPSKVTSIGSYALANCTQIVDTNIPEGVSGNNFGSNAYFNCSSLLHVDGRSYETTHFNSCTKMSTVNGYGANYKLYVMAGAPENGVPDNGNSGFVFIRSNAGVWSALGFSGETGEDENKVFVFPDSGDFSANSDRRTSVKYDYIDKDAKKVKNNFDDDTTVTYNVAASFAEGTWCQNVILPAACTEISARAFYGSHVKYMETYATKIRDNAFYDDQTGGTQWLYFHNPNYNKNDYTIASNAFVQVNTRHIVFEDYTLYSKIHNGNNTFDVANMPTGRANGANNVANVHYQIPIHAIVYNDDDNNVLLKDSDVPTRFFNDSDYAPDDYRVVEGQDQWGVIHNTRNRVVYTKRLNGSLYNWVKGPTGVWAASTGSVANKPTFDNMTETNWFKEESYTNPVTIQNVYDPDATAEITIYTRYIAMPKNIINETYGGHDITKFEYGKTYNYNNTDYVIDAEQNHGLDYYTALGLNNDHYSITLMGLTYASGTVANTSGVTSMQHAGDYKLSVDLNSKWGTWSDEYIRNHYNNLNATATVQRKKINFTSKDISEIPLFVNANAQAYSLHGASTPIYHYNDGWYVIEQDGKTLVEPAISITNSYCYSTGKPITIMMAGETDVQVNSDGSSSSKLGDAIITSRNGLTFTNSGQYIATFMFNVPTFSYANLTQTDYTFYYGELTDSESAGYANVTNAEKGLSITGKQDNFFLLTKQWYIVYPTNMFIGSYNGVPDTSSPYSPIYTTDFEGDKPTKDDFTSAVTYGDTNFAVVEPRLNYGTTQDNLSFSIDYMPIGGESVSLTGGGYLTYDTSAQDQTKTLGYYLNTYMPAGTYSLKLHGNAVSVTDSSGTTNYDEINSTYTITVKAKLFNENHVEQVHVVLRGNNKVADEADNDLLMYLNEYELGTNQLHADLGDVLGKTLNNTLINSKNNLNYYWATTAGNKYFDESVTVLYNRANSGNTLYSSLEDMVKSLVSADTYIIYYSISAKNYITEGGADASDRMEHGFRTLLYTKLNISEIYKRNDSSYPYFKDVTYTGEEVKTLVPSSQYYTYEFTDERYVEAREGATVTLSLYNSNLTRWGAIPEELNSYLTFSDGKLIVKFNINKADNGWKITPKVQPWTYNNFVNPINFISSTPLFSETNVYNAESESYDTESIVIYYYFGQKIDGKYYWLQYDKDNDAYFFKPTTQTDYIGIHFRTIANGQITPTDSDIKALEALPAGEYYLRGKIEGSTNTNSFDPEDEAYYYMFTIEPDDNSWTRTPITIGWAYGSFASEINFINGASKYDTDKIKYTLYKGTATTGESVYEFTEMGDDQEAYFATLGVGTYTLVAHVDGTGNYTALSQPMTFNVTQATNTWTTIPSIQSWAYNDDSTGKLTEGKAKFGTAVYTVQYVSASGEVVGDIVVKVDSFEYTDLTFAQLVANLIVGGKLTKLGADATYGGRYNLHVEVAGDTNYTAISRDIRFTVSKIDNSWVDTARPSISGWTYKDAQIGEPSANGAKAENNGSISYTFFPAREEGSSWIANGAEIKYDSLGSANAGEYIMIATVAATDYYNELTHTVHFTIAKRDIEWDKMPEISLTKGTSDTEETESPLNSSNLVNATIKGFNDYTLTYYISNNTTHLGQTKTVTVTGGVRNNGEKIDLVSALGELARGSYTITITASTADTINYNTVSAQTILSVELAVNSWTEQFSVTVDGAGAWNWDQTHRAVFTQPDAIYGVSTISYTIRNGSGVLRTIRAADFEGNTNDAYNEVVSVILGLDVGSYTVIVSLADTEGYTAPAQTTYNFTINRVTLDWDEEFALSKTEWTYGEFQNSWATKPEIDFGESTLVYTIRRGSNTINTIRVSDYQGEEGKTAAQKAFEALLLSLSQLDANTTRYSITVSVTAGTNYTAPTNTYVEFTVKQIETEWDPEFSLSKTSWAWDEIDSVEFTEPGVQYGESELTFDGLNTIVYTVKRAGGTIRTISAAEYTLKDGKTAAKQAFDDLVVYIKSLDYSLSQYSIVVSIAAGTNYTALSTTVEFMINQVATQWGKAFALSEIEWTYGEFEEDWATMPNSKYGLETIVYTVRKGSSAIQTISASDPTYGSAEAAFNEVVKYIKGLDYGIYSVYVTIAAGANYAALTTTVNFTVNQIQAKWEKEFALGDDSWTWGEFDDQNATKPEIEHGLDTIVYTVRSGNSVIQTISAADNGGADAAYTALIDYIKSLYSGSYSVTVSISSGTNYTAPGSTTVNFVIDKVTTKWDNATDSSDGDVYNWIYSATGYEKLNEPKKLKDYSAWTETVIYTLKVNEASGSLYSGSSWASLLDALNKCETGRYIITAHIDGDINHEALDYSITINISAMDNDWDKWTGNKDSIAKDVEWTYGSSTAPNIVFVPKYNENLLVVTVNRVVVPYTGLAEYIKGLQVGTYLIEATVAADTKYGALVDTVNLIINRADNAWTDDLDIADDWYWSDEESEIDTELILPISKYGDSASVAITNVSGTFTIHYVTDASGKKTVNTNDRTEIISVLRGLGVGSYTITVTVGQLDNYNALEGANAKTATFTVKQAQNFWSQSSRAVTQADPRFSGNNVKQNDDKSYTWVYETDITVVASARFGSVVVYYNSENGDEQWNMIPTNVGKYKAVFTVEETANYAGLSFEIVFEITGKENKVFSVSAGVIPWAWSNYGKTINLFTGIPASGGEVSYQVTQLDGTDITGEFLLVDASGNRNQEDIFGSNLYAPQYVIDKLNELVQGTYRLYVYVKSNGNWSAFTYETTFNVSQATNSWEDYPTVTPWYYGEYDENEHKPVAVPRYGTAVIVITNDDTGVVVYDSANGTDELISAKVGNYTMTVNVAAAAGRYNGLSATITLQIFVSGTQNFWTTVPGIEGWTANIDGNVNMPTGAPLRGKPYFEFFSVELRDGEYVITGKVGAGVDALTVNKGIKYAQTFYVPTKPGTYYMYSYAVSDKTTDEYDDNLGENHSSRIMFTIRDRTIDWEQSVRIPSILYLGDKNNWTGPSAKTNLTGDSELEIWYRYLDATTRRDLGSLIPTTVGKYIVVAHAKARYTDEITSEMAFEVALSRNSWVDDLAPSIDGWSEEFNESSPNPTGAALHGTIFYMYINKKNPDIIFTDKPTAAGDYILIARVELEGYETLEARYEFTIAPAFDTTFVLIDIILGLVACAFAVVVIVFAIRRYKEN